MEPIVTCSLSNDVILVVQEIVTYYRVPPDLSHITHSDASLQVPERGFSDDVIRSSIKEHPSEAISYRYALNCVVMRANGDSIPVVKPHLDDNILD